MKHLTTNPQQIKKHLMHEVMLSNDVLNYIPKTQTPYVSLASKVNNITVAWDSLSRGADIT